MSSNNSGQLKVGQHVKIIDDNDSEVYEISLLFNDADTRPDDQDVKLKPVTNPTNTKTVKRRYLRGLNNDEKKFLSSSQSGQRTLSEGQRGRSTGNPRTQKPPSPVPDTSSEGHTLVGHRPDTKINGSDAAEVELSTRFSMPEFIKGVQEVCNTRIANLFGDLDSLFKPLESALIQTNKELKYKQEEVERLNADLAAEKKRSESRDGTIRDLTEERNSSRNECNAIREEKEQQKKQLDDALGTEKKNRAEEVKYFEGQISRLKETSVNAEQEQQRAQEKVQQDNEVLVKSLKAFWLSREEFYDGLHRGIVQHQGKNPERFQDALDSREESLKTDIALLEMFGCELTLGSEAMNFERCNYDGADHRSFSDDDGKITHGESATVLLPGWTYSDNQITVKPMLGRQEISR